MTTEVVRANPSVTLAVSHYLCPSNMPLIEFLDRITAAGLNSIGITVRALDELPIKQLRQELHARGLGVSSVNTAGYFFEPWQAGTNQAQLNLRLLDAAAELDAANGVNLIVGSSPAEPLNEARQIALEKSAELARQAKSRGTRLLLEPMHPLQARSKGCVNTLKQASQWLEVIPELCLNIDLFHSWWDPDLQVALAGNLGTVAVVQICDVVTDPITNLPKRAPLGEGFVDWFELSGSALSAFPDIPIELEWFADQMPDRDTIALMQSDAKQMQTLNGLRR